MLCSCAKKSSIQAKFIVFSKYSRSCQVWYHKFRILVKFIHILSKYCSRCVNAWKIPKFQWNFSLRYQKVPPHTWTYQNSWVLVKFILTFYQNIAAANAWGYEKFQDSSEIYSYDIKKFNLIHEHTKIPEFYWNLSLRFIKILQLMCERMKNSKIPVKFILTISKNSTSYMNILKFLSSGEIYPYILSKYCCS